MEEKLKELKLFHKSHGWNFPLIKPKILQLSLTNRCNLRCAVCGVDKYATTPQEEMPLEEIQKVIDVSKKQFGVESLILTGGEPLLLGKKLISIVEYADRQGIGIILTTNGFFLEEYAAELAKFKAVRFHVSLDGLKETHNFIRRNPQSFDRAVAGLKALVSLRKKYGYDHTIAIATLILKNNIDELYDLYNFADELGADSFDPMPYLPDNTNFSSTEQSALWPDAADMQKFRSVMERIMAAKTRHIEVGRNFDLGLTESYYQRNLWSTDWKCFAGFKTLFITMSDPKLRGAFEPCLFFCKAHFPIRDANYDLKKLWYSWKAFAARIAIKSCRANCYQICFSLPSMKEAFKKD
ncbi:MAG: radical SAM protein [Candidatus Omnitrophota bacterium]